MSQIEVPIANRRTSSHAERDNHCRSCLGRIGRCRDRRRLDIGEHAKDRVGPELNGLDGRHSGTAAGYSYSNANKNSGIVWSEATFKEYIKDPKAKIPGTKMVFPGIKNEKEADDLWSFLQQYGPDGNKKS